MADVARLVVGVIGTVVATAGVRMTGAGTIGM